MKITYQREMKHNYMIVEGDMAAESGYEARMMAGNHIEGLLRFRVKLMDNKQYYYYEITSRQPLSRLLDGQCIRSDQISRLIFGISQVLERIEAYLLREDQILLDPEYIYMDSETGDFGLCLIPGHHGDFPSSLTKLLQYLLGKVDHQDKESVVMAYGLFQESQKDNYGIEDLLKLLVLPKGDEMKEEEPLPSMEQEVYPADKVMTDKPEKLTVKKHEKLTIKKHEKSVEKEHMGEPQQAVKRYWQQLLLIPILPCLVYVWSGWDGILAYWKMLAVADLMLIVMTAILWFGKRPDEVKRGESTRDRLPDIAEWKMEFEEEMRGEAVKGPKTPQRKMELPLNFGDENTVLLSSREGHDEFRRLVSLDAERADIVIRYYPFIIGKQEGIADYVLARDTVSRLHVRLDEKEGKWVLTDLNSTNGTVINGVLLENNGSSELRLGDEISIADTHYRFL